MSTSKTTTDDTAAAAVAAAPAAGSGGLMINVSEDAYQGNAQFSVTIDGKTLSRTFTAQALHSQGRSQTISIGGSYTAGAHSIVVTFLNDAYGGSWNTDRNLYVNSITLNGIKQTVAKALYSSGTSATANITLAAASSATHPAAQATSGVATPASTTTIASSASSNHLQLLGVNLSGAEFNPGTVGKLNYDYVFPTTGEVDYYAAHGMNVIRLPFLWERLQSTPYATLDKTYLAQIDQVVSYATSKGLKVDLDLHNYGYGFGNQVGSAGTPNSAFANVWGQLASHYAGNSSVMFGLMNEPHDQTAAGWAQSAEAAVAAIRAAGATSQEILVSGSSWDTASTFVSSGNAAILPQTVNDPNHNLVYEVHEYLDSDESGTSTSVVSPTVGADRLQAVTNWAASTGNKLFLGEFGAGQDQASLTALQNMLGYMQQHSAQWQGGTAWAGGPWWGNYGLSVEPSNGVSKPQLGVLSSYAPGHS